MFSPRCRRSRIEALPVLPISVGFMEFLSNVGRSAVTPALPPSPFQIYESKCLEELLCKRRVVSPVKVSGCPSAPQVPRAGLQRWRAARVAVRTSPTLSTPVATALAPLLCPASLCTHGSVNKVRALFLDASTPFACLFPCPL